MLLFQRRRSPRTWFDVLLGIWELFFVIVALILRAWESFFGNVALILSIWESFLEIVALIFRVWESFFGMWESIFAVWESFPEYYTLFEGIGIFGLKPKLFWLLSNLFNSKYLFLSQILFFQVPYYAFWNQCRAHSLFLHITDVASYCYFNAETISSDPKSFFRDHIWLVNLYHSIWWWINDGCKDHQFV